MIRMRTIKAAIRHIKETDPDTAFTEYALRNLVLSGAIPHVSVGRKRLVDLDDVERYLANGSAASSVEPATQGNKIVRLAELRKVG